MQSKNMHDGINSSRGKEEFAEPETKKSNALKVEIK